MIRRRDGGRGADADLDDQDRDCIEGARAHRGVLDRATALKHRGDSPARWKGHLDNLLPSRPTWRRSSTTRRCPSMPCRSSWPICASATGVSARALEFTILCAARTGETLSATWGRDRSGREDVDRSGRPDQRARRAVRCRRWAVADLTAFKHRKGYVFRNGSKPLSSAAMANCRRDAACVPRTAQLAAALRRLVQQRTSTPHEVIEMALAARHRQQGGRRRIGAAICWPSGRS